MLYPSYQADAYICGADNHLWRICKRVSCGKRPTEFKVYVESASEFIAHGDERLYVTTWLTYEQLRGGKYRLERRAPSAVPQLAPAA